MPSRSDIDLSWLNIGIVILDYINDYRSSPYAYATVGRYSIGKVNPYDPNVTRSKARVFWDVLRFTIITALIADSMSLDMLVLIECILLLRVSPLLAEN